MTKIVANNHICSFRSDLNRQLVETEDFIQLYERIVQLKLLSSNGKQYNTDCANTETVLRIALTLKVEISELFQPVLELRISYRKRLE